MAIGNADAVLTGLRQLYLGIRELADTPVELLLKTDIPDLVRGLSVEEALGCLEDRL